MTPRSGNWVDNIPIREAVEQAIKEGDSYANICRRLVWMRGYSKRDQPSHWNVQGPDTTRLKRRLGMMPTDGHCKEGRRYFMTKTMRYDIACSIIQAIGREPHEFNL